MLTPFGKVVLTCAEPERSPGQIAYEQDVIDQPAYPDGEPRRQWHELDEIAQWSWERNPTPRSRRPQL